MKEKRITIALSERLISRIDRRGEAYEMSRPEIIERDLNFLHSLEMFAISEIKGKFKQEELMYLWLQAIDGLEYPSFMDPRNAILNSLNSSPFQDDYTEVIAINMTEADHVKYEEDLKPVLKIRDSVVSKIEGLSIFQVYALLALFNYTPLLDGSVDTKHIFDLLC